MLDEGEELCAIPTASVVGMSFWSLMEAEAHDRHPGMNKALEKRDIASAAVGWGSAVRGEPQKMIGRC